MFTTILGIPAHPLLIHFAVVFIPLLVVGAIGYAALPEFHPRITWAVLALAIIAPFAALFAKLSGQNLRNQIQVPGTSAQMIAKLDQHNGYGNHTFWWTLALGIVTLALVAFVVAGHRKRTASASVAPRPASGAAAGGGSGGVATEVQTLTEAAPVVYGKGSRGNLERVIATVIMLVIGGFTGYYVFKTGDTGAHMVWG